MVLLLDARELTEVKNHLRGSNRGEKQSGGKALALLEAVIANPSADASALGTSIYGQSDGKAFKYLRLRLWNRLVESLDPAPAEGCSPDQELEHHIRCARVLWHRGGYHSLDLLLSTLTRRAHTAECYPVLQDALHLWGRLKRLRMEDSSVLDQQLAEARLKQQQIQAAEALCDHIRLDFPEALPAHIEPLPLDKVASDSPRLRFHQISLRMQLLHQHGRSDDAYKLTRQLQLLVDAHASLQEPDYRVMAACRTAHAAMHMGLPKQALEHLLRGDLPATSCPHLQWQADLLTAEAMRLSGKGQLSVETYHRLLKSTDSDPCAFRKAARHHLAATAALQAGQSERALDWMLPHARDLGAHCDWTMAHRLVQIMALAELEMLEQAELRIEALRKSVAALPAGEWMQQRYHAAVKLLHRWLRMDFTPDLVEDPHFKTLQATAQHSGYGQPERWPLHEWFATKCGNFQAMRQQFTDASHKGLGERLGPK